MNLENPERENEFIGGNGTMAYTRPDLFTVEWHTNYSM